MKSVHKMLRMLGIVIGMLAPAGLVHADVMHPSDLVGWWKMGEAATWNGTTWTVADASGNGNTGTSVNMQSADRVAGYPFNPYPETSYAMQFNGATNMKYVGTPYSASLVIGSSFTLSAWVRQSSPTSGDCMVVSRCDTSALRHNYILQLTSGRVSACFYGAQYGGWPK